MQLCWYLKDIGRLEGMDMSGFEFLAWVVSGFLILSVVSSAVMGVVFWQGRNKSVKEFKKRNGRGF